MHYTVSGWLRRSWTHQIGAVVKQECRFMVHQARVGDPGRHASGGRGICRFAATPERDREHGARANRVAALPATRRTDHDGPPDAQPGFWRPTRLVTASKDISESAASCGSTCPAMRRNFCHHVFKSMAKNDRMPDGDCGAIVASVDGRSRSGGRWNRKPGRDSNATSGIHPQTAGAAKQGKRRGSIARSPRQYGVVQMAFGQSSANLPRAG